MENELFDPYVHSKQLFVQLSRLYKRIVRENAATCKIENPRAHLMQRNNRKKTPQEVLDSIRHDLYTMPPTPSGPQWLMIERILMTLVYLIFGSKKVEADIDKIIADNGWPSDVRVEPKFEVRMPRQQGKTTTSHRMVAAVMVNCCGQLDGLQHMKCGIVTLTKTLGANQLPDVVSHIRDLLASAQHKHICIVLNNKDEIKLLNKQTGGTTHLSVCAPTDQVS